MEKVWGMSKEMEGEREKGELHLMCVYVCKWVGGCSLKRERERERERDYVIV